MKSFAFRLLTALAVLTLMYGPAVLNADAVAHLISKEDLRKLLNAPDLTILDVRLQKDWESSKFKIPGAIHADPRSYPMWVERYPRDKPLILYCA